MEQVTNIAFIRAKPGMSEELGPRLVGLVDSSRSESGCINYDVHQSVDDEQVWCVYENWKSAEDLKSHFDMTYMRGFVDDLPALVDGGLDLRGFRMVSERADAQGS